ncbi:hypothetical protein ACFQ0T_31100 [Kitasatospora gansuensis]
MSKRTLALPALVLSVLLSVSACDPTSPTARPTDHGAAAQVVAVPSDVPSDGNPPVLPAPGGTPSVTLVSPATDRAPSARPVPVAPSAVTPSAAAPSPSGTPAVVAGAADLQLTSYDQRTGTAVLAVANDRTGAPSPSASAATGAVRTGQLIASPPSAAVPQGALLAITAVEPAGAGKVRVETRPPSPSCSARPGRTSGPRWTRTGSRSPPRSRTSRSPTSRSPVAATARPRPSCGWT